MFSDIASTSRHERQTAEAKSKKLCDKAQVECLSFSFQVNFAHHTPRNKLVLVSCHALLLLMIRLLLKIIDCGKKINCGKKID